MGLTWWLPTSNNYIANYCICFCCASLARLEIVAGLNALFHLGTHANTWPQYLTYACAFRQLEPITTRGCGPKGALKEQALHTQEP